MKKYFLFDDEQISGRTYFLRLFVSVLLLVTIIGGIWLMASTAYKRARSLGWDEGFSNIISFLIIIHMSIRAWPDSLLEPGSIIFIITIPLHILQLYMLFKNAIPIKSSATGEKAGRIIGKYLYTPTKKTTRKLYKANKVIGLPLDDGIAEEDVKKWLPKIDLSKKVVKKKKVSRDEAVKQLKEAKEMLDLGILTQDEYDKISAKLKPIIINN